MMDPDELLHLFAVLISNPHFTATMKTLFVLLLGAILGVVGWRYYERSQHPTFGQRAVALEEKTEATVKKTEAAVAGKAQDWKLDSESIKEELAKTGQVVRTKAKAAGEVIDDVRIVAVIKGKYVMEKNLSAFAITVDCRDGQVHLSGSVTSPEHIGKAVTLALGTSGVHDVVSQIVVRN
jgi:osmotically-inducible protein OsmY